MKITKTKLAILVTICAFCVGFYILIKIEPKAEPQKEFNQKTRIEYAFASTTEITDDGDVPYMLSSYQVGTSTYVMTGSSPKPSSGAIVTTLFLVQPDNRLKKVYTSVPNNTDPFVSGDGKHIAYPLYNGTKQSYVIDGIKSKEFSSVYYGTPGEHVNNKFVFSYYSTHHAYIAQTDKGIVIIKDGQIYGDGAHDYIFDLEFTTSNHLIYSTLDKGVRALYVDGKEQTSCRTEGDRTNYYPFNYKEVESVPLIACVVKKPNGKNVMVYNGAQVGGEFDFVDMAILSNDGKQIVFGGTNSVTDRVGADGVRYVHNDHYLVTNQASVLSGNTMSSNWIYMTDDGKHIAYVKRFLDNNEWAIQVVLDGKKGNVYPATSIRSFNFSQDGTEVSYVVSELRTKNIPSGQAGRASALITTSLTKPDSASEMFHQIQGLDFEGSLYREGSSKPTYIGNRYNYPEHDKHESHIVVDGVLKETPKSIITYIQISDDGKHYSYEDLREGPGDREYTHILMKNGKEVYSYISNQDGYLGDVGAQPTFGSGNEFAYVRRYGKQSSVVIGKTESEPYDIIYNLDYDKSRKIFSFFGLKESRLVYHEYELSAKR
jgi:hypothetical protein